MDFSGAVLYICVLLATIVFAGDPDLHDVLMERLSCVPVTHDKE